MDFSQEQLAAIRHGKGPALVTAGPGAGKTSVLTERVRRLLAEDPARRILVISFTVTASEELKKRLFRNGNAPESLFIGTFHSFFLRVLRDSGRIGRAKLITREEALDTLAAYFDTLGPNAREEAGLWLDRYDRLRNEDRTSEGPAFFRGGGTDQFREARTVYERYKTEHGQIDYEDMQALLLRHLREDPGFAASCRNLYEFVLVDEFQDVNPVQFELVRYFLGPEQNLFAVGDEDQAVYGFRGSDPSITVRFGEFFPGCAHYTLYRNFRSGSEIVGASSAFIAHNRARYPKELVSEQGPGSRLSFRLCSTPARELELLRDTLLEWNAMGCAYEDIAVLYRTHSQNSPIAAALSQAGIPFRSPEKVGVPADHEIVRLLASFFVLSETRNDAEAFTRVGRYFALPDHLIREALAEAADPVAALAELPDLTLTEREKTDEAVTVLRRLAALPLPAALRYLWTFAGVSAYAERYRTEHYLEAESQNLLLDRVFRAAGETEDLAAWLAELRKPAATGVTLSTFHAAKGLEFRKVWIQGVCKGILPHPRSAEEEGLEEERRILYVGMTRAREELCVSGYALGPHRRSVFWEELPSKKTDRTFTKP